MNVFAKSFCLALVACCFGSCSKKSEWQESKLDSLGVNEVGFAGGNELDSRDGGRPVKLIAAALNVTDQVFRNAFCGVTPAMNGGPTRALAQANKKILLDALGKHGVTNERLDEVSNFYRYRPQDGESWNHSPAIAKAIVESGKVTGFEIIEPGYSYSSPPKAKLGGFPELILEVKIEFSIDLKQNGEYRKY